VLEEICFIYVFNQHDGVRFLESGVVLQHDWRLLRVVIGLVGQRSSELRVLVGKERVRGVITRALALSQAVGVLRNVICFFIFAFDRQSELTAIKARLEQVSTDQAA